MKKVLILVFACILTSGLFAQEKKTDKMNMKKDCVMMKEGKMMVMKDGKTTEMEKEIILENGTTVMTDGSVKMKDGKTMMMKEGECMYMDGRMMKPKKKP